MRPGIGMRVAAGLRWLRKRRATTAHSGQNGQLLTRPPAGTWSAEPRRYPRCYVPDTVGLTGPGVTELVRYVVDHLALVDGEAFEEYAHAARTVEDADTHGTATKAELEARDAAWRNLAVELPASVRVLVSDVPRIAAMLADAAASADHARAVAAA